MSLIDTIRTDARSARKAQDPLASLYVTLVGEVEGMEKRQTPARALTDAEVLAVVQKFVKNLDETINVLATKDPARVAVCTREREALQVYLPQQMSADEIRAFAEARKAEGADLGKTMGALKAQRAGQYDGKLAAQIVREVLA